MILLLLLLLSSYPCVCLRDPQRRPSLTLVHTAKTLALDHCLIPLRLQNPNSHCTGMKVGRVDPTQIDQTQSLGRSSI